MMIGYVDTPNWLIYGWVLGVLIHFILIKLIDSYHERHYEQPQGGLWYFAVLPPLWLVVWTLGVLTLHQHYYGKKE